jgi:superfamily I DNA and/or RNA helicase
MKIKISIILILVLLFLSTSDSFILATDNKLVNNQSVSISYLNYNKLEKFGFSEDEILDMNMSTFNKFKSRNIISSEILSYNVETTYKIEDDLVVSKTDEILNDTEFQRRIEVSKSLDEAEKQTSIVTTKYANFEIIEPGGGTLDDVTKTKHEYTEYKTFDMYSVYYSDEGNYGEFYVRVLLTWEKEPKKRMTDILTIAYMDNVQLKSELINGQYYPSLHSSFNYDYYRHSNSTYGSYGPVTGHESVIIDGSDYTQYNYNVNEQYIGIEYQLPEDVYLNGHGVLIDHYYENFVMELTLEFTPIITTLNGTTFSGFYVHQTGAGNIDWGDISVTYMPPFFSYSLDFWQNDPSFDDGIGGNVIFEDLR